MKKIELFPGIHSSTLGFGCAPVKGAVSGKMAKRAIDCALDCGINHFDLARSYGYGEAEKFVGKLLRDKRNNLIIASKFGIRSSRAAKILRPVKPLVRYFKKPGVTVKKKESTHNTSNGIAKLLSGRIRLTKQEMQNSLEESLSALNTDYLDYFLIHDPNESLINIEDLSEMADTLKQQGKIRAWGLASMVDNLFLHRSYLDKFDILQFNNATTEGEGNLFLERRKNENNIIFSPLKGGKSWMSPDEKFQKLKKQYRKSIFLSSMFNEKHIIQNSSLFLN